MIYEIGNQLHYVYVDAHVYTQSYIGMYVTLLLSRFAPLQLFIFDKGGYDSDPLHDLYLIKKILFFTESTSFSLS